MQFTLQGEQLMQVAREKDNVIYLARGKANVTCSLAREKVNVTFSRAREKVNVVVSRARENVNVSVAEVGSLRRHLH